MNGGPETSKQKRDRRSSLLVRYRALRFWNKLGAWGDVASIVSIPLAIGIAAVPIALASRQPGHTLYASSFPELQILCEDVIDASPETTASVFDINLMRAKYPLGFVLYATDGRIVRREHPRMFPEVTLLRDDPLPIVKPDFVEFSTPAFVRFEGTNAQLNGLTMTIKLKREVGATRPFPWAAEGENGSVIRGQYEVVASTPMGVAYVLGFGRVTEYDDPPNQRQQPTGPRQAH